MPNEHVPSFKDTDNEKDAVMNSSAKLSSAEIAEDMERAFDVQMETMIATHRIENGGNNGLIMRFSPQDIPTDVQSMLEEHGVSFKEDTAVKLLKVYSPEQGKKEYEMLQRAYELVAGVPNPDDFAKVPKPMLYRELEISAITREYLNQHGAHLDARVAVIMMEHITGKDIATHLYDFVLEQRNYDKATIEEMGFNEKQILVSQALAFRAPGGKASTDGEREFERIQVMMGNAGILMKYVGDHGFRVHPAIIEKIRRTAHVLHKGGLWHNDLHERNVMTKDLGDGNVDVYIIDFGSAGERDESKSSGEMRASDETIVMRLRAIIDSAGIRERDAQQLKNEIESFRDRLKSTGRWNTEYEKARTLFEEDPRVFLDGRFAVVSANSVELDKLIVTVNEMLDDPLVDADKKQIIMSFIRRHRESDKQGYVRKRFSYFDDKRKKDA
ncbi:MAG: hypothetical protein A3J54_00750 [Candidatus Ryanbacteria bacterium RIFCSPHIGHO2_02_FULL_45_13b]|uniref:Uncharacterized protein n=1 Tax=Candidatus Ryanbacteria bacterium RIFCSPHIGHO2_02_FULL_45_13b TaxID=1802117 RepID=A0A1G2G5X1_9BACT|nr:MAG: hypothetical protein A3J54_00750 [Candidatus Ryanbacteria bacterium RIFCSPHIGHO2_02_FULL_45_13b]